jgi:hypothetical protein
VLLARRTLAAAVVVLVVTGCSTNETGVEEPTDAAPTTTQDERTAAELTAGGTAAPLARLAAAKLSHCRKSPRLNPICPVFVPRVRAPYLSHLSDSESDALFNLERGVPGHAPPRAAHVTVGAGEVERSDPFEHPEASDAPSLLADSLLDEERQRAVSFGRVTWGGHDGVLFLAPPFLHGGQLGDHLVFEWGESSDRFAYSLHAWKPLVDTAATLREIVEADR